MALVVREFIDDGGRIPFREWLGTLDAGASASASFAVRIGNLGDHKEVGEGVSEARLDFGPGYRLYFGRRGRELVLLLTGGDKKSQKGDIRLAKRFWSKYLKEQRDG